jgi:hypothetical protein
MKQKIRFAAIIVAVVTLCGLQTSNAKQPSVLNVNVENTPLPVTVQSPVSITGSVTVQNPTTGVTIQNTPNVNVANTPSVKRADNPALQPYAKGESQVPALGTFAFDVPAGKRLVLELVTISGEVSPGNQIANLQVRTRQPDGGTVDHALANPSNVPGPSGNPIFANNYLVRLYAEPGPGSVQVFIARNGAGATFNAQASISGYLVDIP